MSKLRAWSLCSAESWWHQDCGGELLRKVARLGCVASGLSHVPPDGTIIGDGLACPRR